MVDRLRRVWAAITRLVDRARAGVPVLLGAVPTWGAAITAVLTVVAVEVVPLLPGPWAVRVAGWIATLIAAITAIVRVVSRVTPTPPGTEGLVLPPGLALNVSVVRDETVDRSVRLLRAGGHATTGCRG